MAGKAAGAAREALLHIVILADGSQEMRVIDEGMTMTEVLDHMRKVLMRRDAPPDHSIELSILRADGDVLRHRLLVLQSENRALHAALSVLKNEGDW